MVMAKNPTRQMLESLRKEDARQFICEMARLDVEDTGIPDVLLNIVPNRASHNFRVKAGKRSSVYPYSFSMETPPVLVVENVEKGEKIEDLLLKAIGCWMTVNFERIMLFVKQTSGDSRKEPKSSKTKKSKVDKSKEDKLTNMSIKYPGVPKAYEKFVDSKFPPKDITPEIIRDSNKLGGILYKVLMSSISEDNGTIFYAHKSKSSVREEADVIVLGPDSTGLSDIYIYTSSEEDKYGPRIKVGRSFRKYTTLFSISNNPEIILDKGDFSEEEENLIKKWIRMNKELLLDYWEDAGMLLRHFSQRLKKL